MSSSPEVATRFWAESPLPLFVAARHPSVRLSNALRRAEMEGVLPFGSVGEYLADRDPRTVMMRNVRNLGARSADELDRMIRLTALHGLTAEASHDEGAPDGSQVADLIADVGAELSRVRASEALAEVSPGGRLDRLLATDLGESSVWMLCGDLETSTSRVLKIPGMGGRTVEDLIKALRLCVSRSIRRGGHGPAAHDAVMTEVFGRADGPIWLEDAEDRAATMDVLGTVRELLGGMTVAEAFRAEVVSARLGQLVSQPTVAVVALAEMLLDRAAWQIRLRRFANVGATTLIDFWDVCWRRLAAAARALPDDERLMLARVLVVEPERLIARQDDLLAMAVSEGEDCAEMAAKVAVPVELDALLEFLFERIRQSDVPVVRRRFGLDGRPPETLEEIGLDWGVTRERIRQIEKRGLRDMSQMARRVPLRHAIDERAARTWSELAGGDDVLLEKDLPMRRRSLHGSVSLSLELVGLPLTDWLDEMASRLCHGWLRIHIDRAAVDQVVGRLASDLPALPCAVEELRDGEPIEVTTAAVRLGLGLRVHAGYVVDGRLGARPRRTLGAHALLHASAAPLPSAELLRRYRARVPADRCSQRDLSIVMSEASHLFLEISEERWTTLGRAGAVPVGPDITAEDEEEQPRPDTDGTMAAALIAELERSGPQALSQLTSRPRRWLPVDRSVNSIGPTLITRPDVFLRILPGVYCLPHQVPSHEQVISGDLPYLLDDVQARLFAMGRRAGEPWGAFPLWTPAAEMRLCRWASRSKDGEALRSLLAVATIEAWPLDPDERELWRDRRGREGRYELLMTLRSTGVEARPALDRLLAALVDLQHARSTNWMALNRVDGRRVDAHGGCALLAALILLGAVSQPAGSEECAWQLPHPIVPGRAGELRSTLATELHRTGELDWSSPVGARIAAQVRAHGVDAPSWLDPRRFRKVFEAVEEAEPEPREPVTLASVAAAGTKLLAERRLGDFLQWLDGR